MLNKDVVVINGYQRDGTNLVWNILRSHPEICSPGYETGQILHNVNFSTYSKYSSPFKKKFFRSKFALSFPVFKIVSHYIDQRFFDLKMKTVDRPDSRYKSEGVLYKESEIAGSVLCLKSVNEDIDLSELLHRIYGNNCYFIGLIRNGYALCEGWMRRGHSATEAGRIYLYCSEKMKCDTERYPNYKIVRFEDIIKDPFGKSADLFRYIGVQHEKLEKIRVKAGKVLLEDGKHETRFGEENKKYWFDPHDIKKIIVPGISHIQEVRLPAKDKNDFEKYAMPVLEEFGYFSKADCKQ